jgi:hypothetical protein
MSTEYWVLALTFVALIVCVGIFGIFLTSQLRKHRRATKGAAAPDPESIERA